MMMKKLLNILRVVGGLALVTFCLSACDRSLDVESSYDFLLETMPVPKDLAKGETAEIRCVLKRSGLFSDARYTIRYFQPEGKGRFMLDDGTLLLPNDRYPLTKGIFRLYYTSESVESQSFDIYVEDNFGKLQQLTFSFNNKKAQEEK